MALRAPDGWSLTVLCQGTKVDRPWMTVFSNLETGEQVIDFGASLEESWSRAYRKTGVRCEHVWVPEYLTPGMADDRPCANCGESRT